jgi:GxxExxY protein
MYDERDERGGRGRHGGGHGGGGRGGRGGYAGRGERRGGLPLSELDPALTDMSRRVIGCAIDVHKALGPGYPAEIYAAALKSELDENGIAYKAGHALDVAYKGKRIGAVRADLFVGDRFIVGILARVGEVGTTERSELRAQLRAADLELGLVINFGERRLKDGLVRVLNPDKLNAMRGEQEEEEEYEDDDEYEDEEDGDEYEDDDEEEEEEK